MHSDSQKKIAPTVLDFGKGIRIKEQYFCNSLLPVGRYYINMDPSLTELVISQTQFIRFGQFFWAESGITNYTYQVKLDNIKLKN